MAHVETPPMPAGWLPPLGERLAAAPMDRSTRLPAAVGDETRVGVLDSLPVGVVLIDAGANVLFANRAVVDMTGIPAGGLLGRNMLDFVSVDDLDFAVALLNGGQDHEDRVMGPSRVRYQDAAGRTQWTQIWARVAPPEYGLDGYIVALTSESVRDVLASALGAAAEEQSLDQALLSVAASARAMPICGHGVILLADRADIDRPFRPLGEWPIAPEHINAPGTPWREALRGDGFADIEDLVHSERLDDTARQQLIDREFRSVLVRPVFGATGKVIAVYVVFHGLNHGATVSQNEHVADTVRFIAMLIAQAERRAELESRARRDALTGCLNRSALTERLRNDRRAADVLFIDLDHFKTVNDTFGHDIGDRLIADAAERLHHTLRRGDLLYRSGGDEFIVVTESAGTDSSARVGLAERIIDAMLAPFDIGDHRVRIGATVGIAEGTGRTLDATVRAADHAMYVAKERGRSGWAHAH